MRLATGLSLADCAVLGGEVGSGLSSGLKTVSSVIADLIAAGEDAALFDLSDATSLFSATDGSASASVSDPLGLIAGKTGTQSFDAMMAAQPAWRTIDDLSATSLTATAQFDSIILNVPTASFQSGWYRIEVDVEVIGTGAWSCYMRHAIGSGNPTESSEYGNATTGRRTITVQRYVRNNGSAPLQAKFEFRGSADFSTITIHGFTWTYLGASTLIAGSAATPSDSARGTRGSNFVTLDGTDDGYEVAGWTPSDNTTLMVAVRTSDAAAILFDDGTNYALAFEDGSASTTLNSGSGTPSYYLDGVLQSWSTRDDAHTAIADGEWHILEIVDADQAGYADLQIGKFASFVYADNIGGGFLATNPTEDQRTTVRQWMANQVGVSL